MRSIKKMKRIESSKFSELHENAENADDIMFMGNIAAIYCPQCKTVDKEPIRNISVLGLEEFPAKTYHFYKYKCTCGYERIFERVERKLVISKSP